MRDITIVGGSLAGLRAAETLRREGFDGRLRIVSGEDRLPVDRPPLSKQVLAGTWDPEKATLRGAAELDADWMLGTRATAFDAGTRTLTLDTGATLTSDGIVIACGAKPRRLPPQVAPPGLDGVFELRTVDDCLALRAALDSGPQVAVIGAGFIGAEVASTCRSRGLDVTVLEMLPIPLERVLGPQMGARSGRLHHDGGTDLRLGVGVAALRGTTRIEAVELADGTRIDADVVVVGVGVVPDVGWLEGSGLELRDGIVCDSRCRAAEGVVAAGDAARWYHEGLGEDLRVEHWTNAAEQGAAAATALLKGDDAPPYAPVPYFWSDQYGTKIQFIGHNNPGDTVRVVEGDEDDDHFVAAYGRDGRLTAVLLWNRAGRLVHWIGELEAGAPFPEG